MCGSRAPVVRRALAVALATVLALAACTGSDGAGSAGGGSASDGSSSSAGGSASTSPPASADASARLTGAEPCGSGLTCATLTVPLDRRDPSGATLPLQVAVETDEAAPKGILLALAGGPGQAGVPFGERFADRFGAEVMKAYRLVVLDQRGTGNTALRCPALQAAMGFSDLTPPPAGSVTACAKTLGHDRLFYSTEDVVADLDRLRLALGAQRMTVMGTSYGTFVAEHYALGHPRQVSALILDSVVPHGGIDPMAVDVMQASRRVLRAACRAASCPGDPVADLAAVVARYDKGVELLDVLTAMSIVDPDFSSLLPVLRAARAGDPGPMEDLIRGYAQGLKGPADELSQGLHASALCADMRFPWGLSSAPVAGREAALQAKASTLTATDLAPFDRATAVGNGFIRQCLPWPPVAPAGLPTSGSLPDVPTLLLAGGRDLSTPLEWAMREAALAPGGELVIVPTSGHAVYGRGGRGKEAVDDFLLQRQGA